MGMVKIDIHKRDRSFEHVTLSDPELIRILIEERDRLDPYYMAEQEKAYDVAGLVKPLIQEAISLYAALDETIKKCKFKNKHLDLIRYIEAGYKLKEIPQIDDRYRPRSVNYMFEYIIKKIKEKNDEEWYIATYKTVIEEEIKICRKCKKGYPKNTRFFSPHGQGKDGFHPYCKKCRRKLSQ